jgi:transposase InsO family protein
MKALYKLAGISKQGLHQHNRRQNERLANEERIIEQALSIRENHPKMGSRTMYWLIKDNIFGRDQSEHILLGNGLRVHYPPNYLKTTVSQSVYFYPNLIEGLCLNGINQVWQTDITYYIADGGEVFYAIFIVDVYSRRILGHAAHDHMRAEANIKALRRALKTREGQSLDGLIHHSDRGSQYIDTNYRKILADHQIRISMCKQAWENSYTERINGTIKNGYLKARRIILLSDLRRELNRSVYYYNEEKPHRNLLNRMSPIAYEQHVEKLPIEDRPILKIYKHKNE